MDSILDQLLAEKTLHCVRCENLLRAPVMLVKDKGNMCYTCYEECRNSSNILAIENTVLGNILKKMKIPCEYKPQGCDQKLRYEDFNNHKKQCIHQTVHCNISAGCPWTGSLNKLITHYEKDHKDRVLNNSNDCYKLFEIQDIRECFYVLKTSHGTFILKMMKCENRLQISIYDSNKCKKNCQHPVIIKFVTYGGDEYKKKCVATKDLKSFILNNDSSVNNIDLNHIEFLGEDTEVEVIIGLMDHIQILEKMQEKLICSKCRIYIKSNAYSCGKGHNLCSSCNNQQACPLCHTTVIENNVLENVALLTRLPCRYKNVGCMMKIAGNSNHEDTCDFRTWSCFVEGCSSHFRYPDLILHAVKDHQIPIGFARLSKFSMRKNVSEEKRFHVIEHNQVFELCYQNQQVNNPFTYQNTRIDNFKWSVNVIRGDNPNLYAYEVETDFGKTYTGPIKGITLRGSCRSMCDIDFGTKSTSDPVVLSGVSSLYNYTTLQFKVRVFKV